MVITIYVNSLLKVLEISIGVCACVCVFIGLVVCLDSRLRINRRYCLRINSSVIGCPRYLVYLRFNHLLRP